MSQYDNIWGNGVFLTFASPQLELLIDEEYKKMKEEEYRYIKELEERANSKNGN